MKIEYLKVFDNDICYKYNLSSKTLIYSKENSKGKTTLLRFILFALGYQIPATEGIGDFNKFKFEIKLENNDKEMILYRKGNFIEVSVKDSIIEYNLPYQEDELMALIFQIENVTVLKNLLAVFYIDQEKGWTLLNRGKIIGNNKFNIEEFIAGISGININTLLDKKKVINNELKKYRYIKNVLDINNEFDSELDADTPEYEISSMDDLLIEKQELEIQLATLEDKRKQIENVLSNNKHFASMIENYGIMISHKGEEFQLTKENLVDFNSNQDLLKVQINNYKIEESKIKTKISSILRVINEKNSLFVVDNALSTMENMIDLAGIDTSQIDKVIRQLSNQRKNINNQIKNKLIFNNNELLSFYEIIYNYSVELGISNYISNKEQKFVLTNKLKGLSGRVLAQMSFIFKLSYIKCIENTFNIILPIIIDSPRTNELSEESTNAMLKILKRDFDNHQIIIASIYSSDIIKFDEINLNNGLFKNFFLVSEIKNL